MELFESTLLLLLVAVLLTAFSRRIGVPYPSMLALAGAGIAFLPSAPELKLDPDFALALFVAPILTDSGFDTAFRDLKKNFRPLFSLVFVLVALTVVSVAFVGMHWGGLPLAAAIALGAIVAPPDAVAAAAVLGPLNIPRRVMQILLGESLLNDAPALLTYRFAVAAAVGTLVLSNAAPMIALAIVGSFVVGIAIAYFYAFATRRVTDAASFTVLTFIGTFGVWIMADRLGLSAIITVVTYAMTLSNMGIGNNSARLRVSTYSTWETVIFVLNVMAFLIMGLQVRPILARLEGSGLEEALWFSGGVLATVIGVRLFYLFVYASGMRLKDRVFGGNDAPPWRGSVLIGWCGMRGLVTLATAFALPANFPSRDLIVLAAFTVVIGTLVVQGLTLKYLLKLLNFGSDESVERDVSRGRVAIVQTALDLLAEDRSEHAVSARSHYLAVLTVAQSDQPQSATAHEQLKLKIIPKQRKVLQGMRERDEISEEAYHRLEEELDWAELNAAPAGHFQPLTTD